MLHYTIKDYENCLSKVEEIFSSCKGIHSIKQFGSILAPGNSDIDLIFVIDEDRSVYQDILHRFESRFTDSERYLVYQHQPYFVPETVINKINILRPCSNIRSIWGKEYPIQEEFDAYHHLYLLVELFTNYYPAYLTSFSDIRLNLQIINAFRYVVSVYKVVAAHFELKNNFYEKVDGLLKTNNQVRKMNEFSSIDVWSFIEETKKEIFEIIFYMFDQINIVVTKCLRREVSPILKKVYKGKVFSKKMGRLKVIKCFGRTFNIMHYPSNFYYLFGDSTSLIGELRDSIQARNDYLYKYQMFCLHSTFGAVFYLPWWLTWEKTIRNQVKEVVLNVVSIL